MNKKKELLTTIQSSMNILIENKDIDSLYLYLKKSMKELFNMGQGLRRTYQEKLGFIHESYRFIKFNFDENEYVDILDVKLLENDNTYKNFINMCIELKRKGKQNVYSNGINE